MTVLLALGANHVRMFCWEWREGGESILGRGGSGVNKIEEDLSLYA
jgi:hypothetical protein